MTGSTDNGPPSHFATLAYDASSGARKWASEFPDDREFGRGRVITVSPDGETVFVSGVTACRKGDCTGKPFDGLCHSRVRR